MPNKTGNELRPPRGMDVGEAVGLQIFIGSRQQAAVDSQAAGNDRGEQQQHNAQPGERSQNDRETEHFKISGSQTGGPQMISLKQFLRLLTHSLPE